MNYSNRIQKVQRHLSTNGCDALIIENPIDIFYLTGLDLSCGKLIICKEGEAALFVDGRYYEKCRHTAFLDVFLVKDNVLTDWFSDPSRASLKVIAFDSDFTTYNSFIEWQEKFRGIIAKGLQQAPRQIDLVPLNAPGKFIRSIKDDEEIALLRNAAQLGSMGYDFALTVLREGITEKEVATELEIFWLRHGSKSLAFAPIIAFGANSAMPHYHTGNTPLKRGDIVLIDIGVNLDYYHSDMTRCVFFGNPHPLLKEKYQEVLIAQQRALELCRPGARIEDVDRAARTLLSPEHFVHGLGHGVGLEIHEAPVLSHKHLDKEKSLEAGMVITIEPGVYYPGVGGIRIEDTIVITATSYENLTNRSKELIIL